MTISIIKWVAFVTNGLDLYHISILKWSRMTDFNLESNRLLYFGSMADIDFTFGKSPERECWRDLVASPFGLIELRHGMRAVGREMRAWVWRVGGYGLLLAAGTLALQWIDYLWLARTHSGEIYVFLIAALFLTVGVLVGASALRTTRPASFDGNPQAIASLGISPRELTVLRELAAGHSNKEIAQRLHVSPHTVKTHVARLLEKLEARRRTDAIHRARELGILP